jgi:hypothetical protein
METEEIRLPAVCFVIHPPPPGLLAVATDERVDTAAPKLDIDDSGFLVELMEEKFLEQT